MFLVIVLLYTVHVAAAELAKLGVRQCWAMAETTDDEDGSLIILATSDFQL